MFIQQAIFESDSGWKTIFSKGNLRTPQLVLAFGNRGVIANSKLYAQLQTKYPQAAIIIAST